MAHDLGVDQGAVPAACHPRIPLTTWLWQALQPPTRWLSRKVEHGLSLVEQMAADVILRFADRLLHRTELHPQGACNWHTHLRHLGVRQQSYVLLHFWRVAERLLCKLHLLLFSSLGLFTAAGLAKVVTLLVRSAVYPLLA